MAFDLIYGQDSKDWSRGGGNATKTTVMGGSPTPGRILPAVATLGVLIGGFALTSKIRKQTRALGPRPGLFTSSGGERATTRLPAFESMHDVVDNRLR